MSDYYNHPDELPLFAGVDTQAPAAKPKEESWHDHVRKSIDQADANADEAWKQAVRESIRHLAETRKEFTADDVKDLMDKRPETTHEPSASGAVFTRAARDGWIENTCRAVPSRRKERHRKLFVWRSLIYRGGDQ